MNIVSCSGFFNYGAVLMKKINTDEPSVGVQALKCFVGVALLFSIWGLFYGFYDNVVEFSLLTVQYAYINSQFIVLALLAIIIFMGCLSSKIVFSPNYYGTGMGLSILAVIASIACIYKLESVELVASRRDFIFSTMYFMISAVLVWRFGYLLEKHDPDKNRVI